PTCKHLRKELGGLYENARIRWMKKYGARLPSGIRSHTSLETIDSEPKQPDIVADVQKLDDKTISNEIELDRISDGSHDPNSLIADSARNLNAESNASSALKDTTPSKQLDTVDIDKLMDDSSELGSKPASKKSSKSHSKKADLQLPHATSAELDSATSTDMTLEARRPDILQPQENDLSTLKVATPNKQIEAVDIDKLPENPSELEPKPDSKKSRKTRAKKADLQLPDAALAEVDSVTPLTLASKSHAPDMLQTQENDSTKKSKSGGKKKLSARKKSESVVKLSDVEVDLDHMYGQYIGGPASDMSKPAAETADVRQQPANSAVLDLVKPSADFEALNAPKVENSNKAKPIDVEDGPKVAKSTKKSKRVEESEEMSGEPSNLESIAKSTDHGADDASPFDAEDGPKAEVQSKKGKKLKSSKKSKRVDESEEMSETSIENLECIAKSTGHGADDASPIEADDGPTVDVQPKKAKKSKSAKPSKGVKESEEMPAEASPQKLESIAKSTDHGADDARPVDAEGGQVDDVQPKMAKKSKSAKTSKGLKESKEMSAEPSPQKIEGVEKLTDHAAEDASPIDADDGQQLAVQPKKAKKSKAAKSRNSEGVKESEEKSAERSPQSIAKSTDHGAEDANLFDADDGPKVEVQPKKAKQSKSSKKSKRVEESEGKSGETSTENLESIAKSNGHGADDASPIDAGDGPKVVAQPKKAKQSKSSKKSKRVEESEEMTGETSAGNLESIAKSTGHGTDDASPIEADDGPTVDIAESSPQKIEVVAKLNDHGADDASPIDAEDSQMDNIPPKKAKKSKSAKTSTGVKESGEMSVEPSPQKIEGVAKSADDGADDASPIDAEDGPKVDVLPKKAKKSKAAKSRNSERVKESEEKSAEFSPQSIANSTDHGADDASSIDAGDGPT
ncbi:hypothetical protein HDU80_001875, partial [Chytriomyces hyalinus]